MDITLRLQLGSQPIVSAPQPLVDRESKKRTKGAVAWLQKNALLAAF